MILKTIISILIEIIGTIFSLMGDMLPHVDFIRYYEGFFTLIGNVIEFAVNFLYFLIGEAMFPILTIANLILAYRYIVFPVAVIIRRVFIKGGDT